jgi:hypothetical protein
MRAHLFHTRGQDITLPGFECRYHEDAEKVFEVTPQDLLFFFLYGYDVMLCHRRNEPDPEVVTIWLDDRGGKFRQR